MTDQSTARPAWHYAFPVAINFLSVLLSFSGRILLARLIGPAAFGTFAVWENNVQLFGTLGTSGERNHAIRELARPGNQELDKKRRLAMEAVTRTMVVGIVFGVTGSIFFLLLQDGPGPAAILQILAALAFALMLTLSALHRARGSIIVGILFDRLIYQSLFVLLLVAGGAAIAGAVSAVTAYTLLLVVAAGASIAYLLKGVGWRGFSVRSAAEALRNGRNVLPFFFVNCFFVVNARYLLGYSGIFLAGGVLGQVGLVFTIVAIMIIPTSTLNLIVAPILARRLNEPAWRNLTALYLLSVTALSAGGLLIVFLAHPLIFQIADIEQTISSTLVLLLCAGFGLTLIGNAVLTVEQLRGQAAEAAKVFGAAIGAKLAFGYLAGEYFGVTALFWTDVALGLLMLAVLLSRLLTAARKPVVEGD